MFKYNKWSGLKLLLKYNKNVNQFKSIVVNYSINFPSVNYNVTNF